MSILNSRCNELFSVVENIKFHFPCCDNVLIILADDQSDMENSDAEALYQPQKSDKTDGNFNPGGDITKIKNFGERQPSSRLLAKAVGKRKRSIGGKTCHAR